MADSDNHNNHVSFMVDARGGGIRGTWHSGLRMVNQDYMPNDRERKVTPPTVAERG